MMKKYLNDIPRLVKQNKRIDNDKILKKKYSKSQQQKSYYYNSIDDKIY